MWNDDLGLLFPSLFLYPLVIEGLLRSEPHVSLPTQKVGNQVFSVIADRLPDSGRKVKAPMEHVMQDLVVIFATEGRSTAQHDEHHNSHWPVITLSGVTSFEDLWCDVVWGSIWRGHELVLCHFFGKSEINELDMRVIVIFVQQEILRFDISRMIYYLFNIYLPVANVRLMKVA